MTDTSDDKTDSDPISVCEQECTKKWPLMMSELKSAAKGK